LDLAAQRERGDLATALPAVGVPGRPGAAGQRGRQRARFLYRRVRELPDRGGAGQVAAGRSISGRHGRRRRWCHLRCNDLRALSSDDEERRTMAVEETGVDTAFRQQVVAEMSALLMQSLERDEPVTEQMR